MPETRLHQLLKFLEEDPNDPFNIYAVALEYQKINPAKALEFYAILLDKYDSYVPTYYHLGKLKQEMEDLDGAKMIFARGISMAEDSGDYKALKELKNALAEIEYD